MLFNNIDDKLKGIESLLKCNYVSKVSTPVDTPRDKFVSCIEETSTLEEEIVKGTTKIDDMFGEEVPKGTTLLDNIIGDGWGEFMKNDLEKLEKEVNEINIVNEEILSTIDDEYYKIADGLSLVLHQINNHPSAQYSCRCVSIPLTMSCHTATHG